MPETIIKHPVPSGITVYMDYRQGDEKPDKPYILPMDISVTYSSLFHFIPPWLCLQIATVSSLMHPDCPIRPGNRIYVNEADLKPGHPLPAHDTLQNSYQKKLI